MRPRITPPKAAVTTRATAALAAGCAALLLALTGCGNPAAAEGPSPSRSSASASASDGKNGDTPPEAQAQSKSRSRAGPARIPVPRGAGSRVPYDFNGDGHRDLVVDDLVRAPGDRHGDDAGIGIVYGSDDRPLDPAARQLLSARANAAKYGDTLPAAFDAESACDLDRDGFTDLIVSTDPPYNGVGAPPVPLQILFGSPTGLTGKAVTVRIPQKARFDDEWPEQPVCGDFDGDGKADLAATAGDGRVTFLHGPFSRTGAPRGADLLPGGGPYLYAPEPRADTDGDGDDDLVTAARPHAPGQSAKGTLLLGSAKGPARPGGAYAFRAEDLPEAPLTTTARTRTTLLDHGDYDADKKQDTVVRTYRGERQDLIALYPAGNTDRPLLTFSTALFLP
ncbi:FG-GAP repeat domain-containing protein [Streptomyces sp. rh34]|uniref:FG-GAP repeat domain-containing protein n=1 Tax=Streptomyces sp. rh34 TaxID=2034272 RepID=UPI000BEF844E|nr:VCBS repeat-containing protein [Streptomyces sp. rh34]